MMTIAAIPYHPTMRTTAFFVTSDTSAVRGSGARKAMPSLPTGLNIPARSPPAEIPSSEKVPRCPSPTYPRTNPGAPHGVPKCALSLSVSVCLYLSVSVCVCVSVCRCVCVYIYINIYIYIYICVCVCLAPKQCGAVAHVRLIHCNLQDLGLTNLMKRAFSTVHFLGCLRVLIELPSRACFKLRM